MVDKIPGWQSSGTPTEKAARLLEQLYYGETRRQPRGNDVGGRLYQLELGRMSRIIRTLRALGWKETGEEEERRKMAETQRDRMHGRLTTTATLYQTAMRQFTSAAARAAALERELAAAKLLLASAVLIAQEASAEWDTAPEGMRSGKLLLALSGYLPGYRADTDAIHDFMNPPPVEEEQSTTGTA